MNQEPVRSGRPFATLLTCLAGVVTAVLRVVPHPPGFTSMGSLGVFGGARLAGWRACAVPLLVFIASDLLLWTITGFNPMYSIAHISRAYVYASFLLYILLGWLAREKSTLWLMGAAALGGVQFFLVTNFFTWLTQPWLPAEAVFEPLRYSRDLAGLLHCYAAALPFYQGEMPTYMHPLALLGDFRMSAFWTIIADVACTGVLAGAHDAVTSADKANEPVPTVEA